MAHVAPAGIETSLTCFLIRQALTREECAEIRASTELQGFERMGVRYPPRYRDNDRLVRDDPALAARLLERIEPQLPREVRDDQGRRWKLVGLNPRFRFCRYQGGQSFCLHQDGAYAPDARTRSLLTCMTYLNDAAEFEGGETRFYSDATGASGIGSIRPEAGTMIVFDHALWHDGQPVPRGTKVVMRTDILYERLEDQRSPDATRSLGAPLHPRFIGDEHLGYVWTALRRRDGTLATGSRDRSILLWRSEGDGLIPTGRLEGHTASVLGLAEDGSGALWSVSRDSTVRRWRDGGADVMGRHEGAALCVRALRNGSIVTGGADGIVLRWDIDAPPRRLEGPSSWIWGLAETDAGTLLAASEDGALHAWTADGMHSRWTGPGEPLRSLAILADGRIAAGDAAGTLTIWREHEGVLTLERTRRVHRGAVVALHALPGGRLASGSEDCTAAVLDAESLEPSAVLPHDGFVRALALLDDQTLATGSYDSRVRLWSLAEADLAPQRGAGLTGRPESTELPLGA